MEEDKKPFNKSKDISEDERGFIKRSNYNFVEPPNIPPEK